VGGLERLEERALLHAGPVARHVAAAVRAPQNPPTAQGPSLQQALLESYASPGAFSSVVVQTRDAAIIVPSGLVPGRNYPLVVAFAWNGSPGVPFEVWRTLAEQNHWIVYGSKDYQNAVLRAGVAPSVNLARVVKAQLDALAGELPIDTSRIIFTGYSGGGNYAEFMNLVYPGYAAAVISNSGRIPSELFRRRPTPGSLSMPTAADYAGSRREAVLIASPGDNPFYGDSLANVHTWESLGWDTLFVSIPGGHVQASPATYDRIIAWITSQPSWTAGA
jgi:poly(3-hydroxybutyrate) depolymerase